MNRRAPEMPVTLEERLDVEDDMGMPEEETQLHSLPGFVCVDIRKEQFEGSGLQKSYTERAVLKWENIRFIFCNRICTYFTLILSPLKSDLRFFATPLL